MLKCNALTNGLTILPNGKVAPCCLFDNNYAETFKSGQQRFIEIRSAFDRGEKHTACSACWTSEADGMTSLRESFYNTKPITNGINFLDLRNTNICNLACRMCGPFFSSTIAKAEGREHYITRAPLDDYVSDIDFDQLNDVYFTGGEPFQNPDHWRVLELIKNPEKVTLRYNSNLTTLTYKDRHIFDYWRPFRNIFFQVSLEGYGELNDMIRIGSSWDNIQKNLEQLLEYSKTHSNFRLAVFVCISMMNVWELETLVDYLNSVQIPEINAIYIEHPDTLSLSSMPPDRRHRARDILQKIIPKTTGNFRAVLESSIRRMETEDTAHLFRTGMFRIKRDDAKHGLDLFGRIQKHLL